MTANDKISKAKRLLRHYIQTSFEGSGLQWDNDNVSEVDEIVDLIIDATIQTIETKQKESGWANT